MGATRNRPLTPLRTVTREVRWFLHGPLPASFVDWFTASDDAGRERRVDLYDLSAAANGVGQKYRGRSTTDTKTRLAAIDDVRLAPGMAGTVEDWEKTSIAQTGEGVTRLDRSIAVSKNRLTRRFPLDGSDDTGCEAELVDIEAGGIVAWSLCFETFGDPSLRADALRHGVRRLLSETPLPGAAGFDSGQSLSYPDWLASLSHQTV